MSKKKIILIIISVILSVVIMASLFFVFFSVIPKHKEEQKWKEMVNAYRKVKLEAYIKDNGKYSDYEIDVAFLGDSLTDGYDLEKYYPQYKVVNRGIGGDTTFDLEKRLQVSAYDLKPKVVVMLIGANNFKTMFNNYENIVKGLKSNLPNTKIVLLSLTAMSGKWGKNNKIACFNNVKIKLIAEKYDCSFIDLFTPLFNVETNGIFADYTTDGGHLTPKGYEVITKEVTPILEELLNK